MRELQAFLQRKLEVSGPQVAGNIGEEAVLGLLESARLGLVGVDERITQSQFKGLCRFIGKSQRGSHIVHGAVGVTELFFGHYVQAF